MVKKEPVKIRYNRGASLMKDIKYKTPSKNWRPTRRFWSKSYINIETGETKDTYVVANNKEQEKEWEEKVMGQVEFFWKTILGDKYDWFMKNMKYLIDERGKEEFSKWWNKNIRENKNFLK